jgi:lipopolysaccharide export system permease protein
MQQAILMLDRVVSRGIDPLIVLEVFLIQMGWILALGVPMAILIATLMTFGRMAGDNEITAIKASGRSMAALITPVMVWAAVVTVALFYFHDLILPEANHRAANLLGDIARKRPAAFIEPGVLIRDFQNYALYTEDINSFSGDMSGIRIFSDAPGEDPMVTVADSGNIRMTPDGEYLELSLFNGETHSISRGNDKNYFTARFRQQTIYIKNVDTRFERTSSGNRGDREMNIAELMSNVREMRASNLAMRQEYEIVLDSIRAITARSEEAQQAIAQSAAEVAESAPPPRARRGGVKVPPEETRPDVAPRSQTDRRADARSAALGRRDANRLLQYQAQAERLKNNMRANDLLIAQYMVEVHKKFAIPAACLIFVLIGAPLGIMARRGGLAVGASYSVFFFVIYWAFLIMGENWGDKMIVSPAVAMWSGNVFLTICGLILMTLMLRETSINLGFLKNIFGKSASVFRHISNSLVFRIPGMFLRLPRLLLNKSAGRLPAYLLVIFLGYAFGLLLALIIIFITIDYVGNLRRFENANYTQILTFYYYYTPWVAQTVLPIVLFLSSMFSMGKIAKTSELTAMKAAGVNVRQLTMPLLLLGLLLSGGVFYGGELVIPRANEKRALLQSDFNRPASADADANAGAPRIIREFRRNFYYFAEPGIVYFFSEFSTDPQFFRGVRRYTFTSGGITERIDAAETEFDDGGWRFVRGQRRVFAEEDGAMRTETFESLPDDVLAVVPLDLVKRVRSRTEMSYWELAEHIEVAKRRGEKVHKLAAELEFKIALPFMNFIVILFGLSLAARTGRRGGAALFGVGLLLSFLFWILSRFLLVFAQNGYIPIVVGAWLGNVIFFVLGVILYRKAAH